MGTVEAFVCFVRRYSIEFMQGFGDHSSYDILSILLFYVWNRYSVLLLQLEARCALCKLVAAGRDCMLRSSFCARLRRFVSSSALLLTLAASLWCLVSCDAMLGEWLVVAVIDAFGSINRSIYRLLDRFFCRRSIVTVNMLTLRTIKVATVQMLRPFVCPNSYKYIYPNSEQLVLGYSLHQTWYLLGYILDYYVHTGTVQLDRRSEKFFQWWRTQGENNIKW